MPDSSMAAAKISVRRANFILVLLKMSFVSASLFPDGMFHVRPVQHAEYGEGTHADAEQTKRQADGVGRCQHKACKREQPSKKRDDDCE
jgi:hypothetical protein